MYIDFEWSNVKDGPKWPTVISSTATSSWVFGLVRSLAYIYMCTKVPLGIKQNGAHDNTVH